MALPSLLNLPASGDTSWYDYATSLDTLIRAIAVAYDSAAHWVIWNGTAYPARPTGVPAGFVEYYGPSEPTTWLVGDHWTQT